MPISLRVCSIDYVSIAQNLRAISWFTTLPNIVVVVDRDLRPRYTLLRHQERDHLHQPKPFPCPQCGVSCSNRHDARRHQDTDRRTKQVFCSRCGRWFTRLFGFNAPSTILDCMSHGAGETCGTSGTSLSRFKTDNRRPRLVSGHLCVIEYFPRPHSLGSHSHSRSRHLTRRSNTSFGFYRITFSNWSRSTSV